MILNMEKRLAVLLALAKINYLSVVLHGPG
jgi:hypothetical protein